MVWFLCAGIWSFSSMSNKCKHEGAASNLTVLIQHSFFRFYHRPNATHFDWCKCQVFWVSSQKHCSEVQNVLFNTVMSLLLWSWPRLISSTATLAEADGRIWRGQDSICNRDRHILACGLHQGNKHQVVVCSKSLAEAFLASFFTLVGLLPAPWK